VYDDKSYIVKEKEYNVLYTVARYIGFRHERLIESTHKNHNPYMWITGESNGSRVPGMGSSFAFRDCVRFECGRFTFLRTLQTRVT